MNKKYRHKKASNSHIQTLLRRRDHLKKVADQKKEQGKSASFDLAEISALTAVLDEILALRALVPEQDEDAISDFEQFDVSIEDLSIDEIHRMYNFNGNKFEVVYARSIQFSPTNQIRITQSVSPKQDRIKIGRWRLDENTKEWKSAGGVSFSINQFRIFLTEIQSQYPIGKPD